MAALADGRLASGDENGSIIIWNVATGTQLAKLEASTDPVRCLAALEGDRLASSSSDESIIICTWTPRRGSAPYSNPE